MAKGKDANPEDNRQLPRSGSKNTYDMNAIERTPQPKYDAFRAKNAAEGFVRHPPHRTRDISKGAGFNDPNVIGNANLKAQIEVAGEQENDDVDGL